ncbi:LuxR family two component transcriptional regulator [Roseinatronobacter thiooxidans]|uniref:LuxR family two component transcriptional regulator n=1 Tax=Roseinatronobacter thiooxidans TaxID=121821 RepID=A0A2W7QE21_9RHOB|nr:response regulator transcription factor [Roseinatronobacter thiooxidans]PZX39439.1 LuxR family two component transcriptional regulator [Roseinatronobacter thiooxidans]
MTLHTTSAIEPVSSLQILVVDDHSLVCETLSAALEAQDDLEAQSVNCIDDALSRIAETGRFDVVLLDYEVPGMDGLNGLRRLVEVNQGAVALFSGVASRTVVERAIDAGAGGFIPKTLPFRTLKHAVRLIAEGELYLPGEFLRRASDDEGSDLGLKPRELRVLGLLCEGMQNKEIGREIGIEETIVKMDVKSICRKMGARNRTQVVIEAMKRGLF